jgi:hypothetical protein
LLFGICGTIFVFSSNATAEELEVSGSARVASPKRAERVVGAGHTTLVELSFIDTNTAQLNNSFGVGAYGTLSSALATPGAHAPSARAARFMMGWHLAGGESGFDGLFRADFGHGVRWPAYGHGFVIRGGADLKFAGNRQYYLSSFNAPNLDAGYQYVAIGKLLELSLRTSLLWDGRFRSDSLPSMNLPTTVGWGGLLEAGSTPFWMSLQFVHGGDVTQLNADLCSQTATHWSLCVRTAHVTEAWLGGNAARHLTTGTLSVGWAPFGT